MQRFKRVKGVCADHVSCMLPTSWFQWVLFVVGLHFESTHWNHNVHMHNSHNVNPWPSVFHLSVQWAEQEPAGDTHKAKDQIKQAVSEDDGTLNTYYKLVSYILLLLVICIFFIGFWCKLAAIYRCYLSDVTDWHSLKNDLFLLNWAIQSF